MMKTFLVYSVHLCFVLFCIATCLAEPKEPKRSKLSSSVYALTPSLRVGRRSEGSWETSTDFKRRIGNMLTFPRLTRGDSNLVPEETNYGAKRPGANSGMWFGPRLGRVQKRSDDYTPWTYIILNGEGPVIRQVHYSPRLGRESEEIYDEMDSNDIA